MQGLSAGARRPAPASRPLAASLLPGGLLLAASLLPGWLLPAGCVAGAHDAVASSSDAATAALEQEVGRAVNDHRRSRGLPALAWSPAAARLAREHSAAMAGGRVGFGHAGFEARTGRLRETLALRRAAENVSKHRGRGDDEVSKAALAGWLASDVHRRNLEGPYQLAGVGAARASDGTVFLTQIFVAVKDAAQRVPGERSSKASLASSAARSDQSSPRRAQSMVTSPSPARARQSSRLSGGAAHERARAQRIAAMRSRDTSGSLATR